MDPLSSYEYPYGTYTNIQTNIRNQPCDIKNNTNLLNVEIYQNESRSESASLMENGNELNLQNLIQNAVLEEDPSSLTDLGGPPEPIEEIDTKDNIVKLPFLTNDIKPKIRKIKKTKDGRNINNPSKKIQDKNYTFYACAVCKIAFKKLHELDTHVTIHKDRVTSYELKIKNRLRKKFKLDRRNKKLKKKKDVKQELFPDIEIKPEDGYIGTEKASEYQESQEITNDHTMFNGNMFNSVNQENSENIPENNRSAAETVMQETEKLASEIGKIIQENIKDITDPQNSQKEGASENSNNDDKKDQVEKNKNIMNDLFLLKNQGKSPEELLNLEKIYKCFACNKQFTLSYYLKLHVRSHTDEKPYVCSTCGQSFITASKLGRHNKRIHLAVKYYCRICFRMFTRFENLTRHFDKKHAEDKLEGEIYDYNAIVPYLKEVEEHLKDEMEKQKCKVEEKKPKAEDLWNPEWDREDKKPVPAQAKVEKETKHLIDQILYPEQSFNACNPPEGSLEIAIEPYTDIKVKVEIEEGPIMETDDHHYDDFPSYDQNNQGQENGDKRENKDGNVSDEDYFPSNTWVSTPKPDPALGPPSPYVDGEAPKRRRKKWKKGDPPLQCEICHKTMATYSYLKVHLRTHTGEKPFKCFICDRGFITSSKMTRHVLTHEELQSDEDRPIKKEEGGETKVKVEKDENAPDLAEGKKGKKRKRNLKSKAAKLFKLKGPRKGTKRVHKCEFCEKKFLHMETLNVHKRSHEGEVKIIKCHYCLDKVDDEDMLKAHEATHQGPKPFVCTICGKCYKRRETMVYHRKNHKADQIFKCDICCKVFNAAAKLERHLVSHRVDKFTLKFECPVCAHMFHTKYHIQMHLTTHQKEGLILEENRNDVLAMVLQNAKKIPKEPHLPITLPELPPDNERSRICNICGEVFQHFYFLEEHLKTHGSKLALDDLEKEEEKKHVCPICNKSFKLHYYLKLHSFTHSKEKPFICQQCGKGFITRGKLKRHLETHQGLKKYQCHVCYKFFTRPSYMRIHVRTIHGTQDYNFSRMKEYGIIPTPSSMSMSMSIMSDGSGY